MQIRNPNPSQLKPACDGIHRFSNRRGDVLHVNLRPTPQPLGSALQQATARMRIDLPTSASQLFFHMNQDIGCTASLRARQVGAFAQSEVSCVAIDRDVPLSSNSATANLTKHRNHCGQ
eukprot:CAMPEP_0183565274 /NCGR_PEP_ID=MMETSP0371-20130417/108204_2 /TAXON_ID=268820 /ORGANISM="Peridinium aciculiferum, Strain PAER-2" /LENGTH=118 /DNA_ID=CAMNT_0025774393 /DNA_START=1 /DNA_END=354 /DNA_ORIENTATION=-